MRKKLLAVVAIVVSVAILLTAPGCFGSFNLVKKVYSFNKGLGEKWIQEIGFLVMSVVPIYEGAAFIDAVILNSIEFWTGKNPIAATINSNDGNTQVTYNTDNSSIRYIQEGTEYVFEKSSEGTIVKDKNGKFIIQCQALDDGGIILKDVKGGIVASYTPVQVQNLYSYLESFR